MSDSPAIPASPSPWCRWPRPVASPALVHLPIHEPRRQPALKATA